MPDMHQIASLLQCLCDARDTDDNISPIIVLTGAEAHSPPNSWTKAEQIISKACDLFDMVPMSYHLGSGGAKQLVKHASGKAFKSEPAEQIAILHAHTGIEPLSELLLSLRARILDTKHYTVIIVVSPDQLGETYSAIESSLDLKRPLVPVWALDSFNDRREFRIKGTCILAGVTEGRPYIAAKIMEPYEHEVTVHFDAYGLTVYDQMAGRTVDTFVDMMETLGADFEFAAVVKDDGEGLVCRFEDFVPL